MKRLSWKPIAIALLTLTTAAPCWAVDTSDVKLPPSWIMVGSQHVRDGAEQDLAVLAADHPLRPLQTCLSVDHPKHVGDCE